MGVRQFWHAQMYLGACAALQSVAFGVLPRALRLRSRSARAWAGPRRIAFAGLCGCALGVAVSSGAVSAAACVHPHEGGYLSWGSEAPTPGVFAVGRTPTRSIRGKTFVAFSLTAK